MQGVFYCVFICIQHKCVYSVMSIGVVLGKIQSLFLIVKVVISILYNMSISTFTIGPYVPL